MASPVDETIREAWARARPDLDLDAPLAEAGVASSADATFRPADAPRAAIGVATGADAEPAAEATISQRITVGGLVPGGPAGGQATISEAGTVRARARADRAASAPPPAPRAPEAPAYEILGEIARGGMGVVYRAYQQSLRRVVALKQALADGGPSAAPRDAFLAEARVTGQLDHPNIVPTYDLGVGPGGDLLLAMKLVGGRSWRDLLAEAPAGLAPPVAPTRAVAAAGAPARLAEHLAVLVSVCNAVAFAHRRGIVHCDLKPANVMVGELGEVLVMDWGVAVDVRSPEEAAADAHATHSTAVRGPRGTPAYMPPELAEGRGEAIGPWTDVYLLGAILHEVLAGAPPHRGGSLFEVLLAASESRPPRLPADAVPAELAAICLRALARDPDARHPTAEAFRDAVQGFLRHRESIQVSDEAQRALARCRGAATVAGPAPIADPGASPGADAGAGPDRAATSATSATRESRYAAFAEAVAGFRQAAVLWSDNPEARQGEREARLSWARAALEGGDLGLARAQVAALAVDDAEATALASAVEDAERARARAARAARRLRGGLAASVAALVATLSLGLYLVDGARTEAVRERNAKDEALRGEVLAKEHVIEQRDEIARERNAKQEALVDREQALREKSAALDAQREALAARTEALAARTAALAEEQAAKALAEARRQEVERVLAEVHVEKARALLVHGDALAVRLHARKALTIADLPEARTLLLAAEGLGGRLVAEREGDVTSLVAAGAAIATLREGGAPQLLAWKGEHRGGLDPVAALAPEALPEHGYGRSLALDPTGTVLAAASTDAVHLFALPSGAHRGRISTQGHVAAFARNGELLTSGIGTIARPDHRIARWRLGAGGDAGHAAEPLGFLAGHGRWVTALAASPTADLVASGSMDDTVRLWDLARGEERWRRPGHRGLVSSLAFSPDGSLLATAGGSDLERSVGDPVIRLLAVEDGAERLALAGHEGPVTAVAFSADGAWLASASVDGTARVWDLQRGRVLLSLRHRRPVAAVGFAAGDGLLLTGTRDFDRGALRAWDLGPLRAAAGARAPGVAGLRFSPDGKHLFGGGAAARRWSTEPLDDVPIRFPGLDGAPSALALDSTGETLAAGSADGEVALFRCADGAEVRRLDGQAGSAIVGLALLDDGQRLVAASRDRTIAWRVVDGAILRTLPSGGVLALDRAGRRIATARDLEVSLWDAAEGRLVRTLGGGHRSRIRGLAFAEADGGASLLSVSGGFAADNALHAWRLAPGEGGGSGGDRDREALVDPDAAPTDELGDLAMSPDGRTLAVAVNGAAGLCSRLVLWDVAARRVRATHRPFGASVGSRIERLAFHPEGQIVAVSGSQEVALAVEVGPGGLALAPGPALRLRRTIRLVDAVGGRVAAELFVDGSVAALAFTPDGRQVVSAGDDGAIRFWDWAAREPTLAVRGRPHNARALALGPDGALAATAGDDGPVSVWEIATGREVAWLRGHVGAVAEVAFAPAGGRVASAGADGTVRVWELGAAGAAAGGGRLLVRLRGERPVRSVAFAPSGDAVVYVAGSEAVRAAVPEGGSRRFALANEAVAAALSPDGRWLACGAASGAVSVLDLALGREVHALRGHAAAVTALAWSPDGRTLATASDDRTARLWDLESGREIAAILDHQEAVTAVAFSPDGRALATAGRDDRVRLHALEPIRALLAPAAPALEALERASGFRIDGVDVVPREPR